MSGNSYLLDTNIAIAILAGEIDLQARRDQGQRVLLCPTVIGELIYGAEKSARPRPNLERLRVLSEKCELMVQDEGTAHHYGRIKASLRRRGRPIPGNDVWIAASAVQHDLVLATRDAHFQYVEGLTVIRW